jgi:6-phosphofructokinase 1
MVTIQNGVFRPLKFENMLDPATGRTRVRMVNIDTEYYKIARRYMLRLRRDDFDSPEQIARFAAIAKISPDEFVSQFEYLVKDEAPPIRFNV